MRTFTARREHVIEPAVADVIGPAVAADNPNALFDQEIGNAQEILGQRRNLRLLQSGKLGLQLGHQPALVRDVAVVLLLVANQRIGQFITDLRAQRI